MQLAHGQLVSDQYEIIETIGKGGFGVVYRAHDRKLDREVALKILLHQDDHPASNFGLRFQREIKLVRQLEHPNIVRLYDFGEMQDIPYMVMEFVRGKEVADHLFKNGPTTYAEAKSIMLQLLDGLVAAHSLNIIHRDLKPSNLMMTEVGMRTDFIKILDFGIAKAINAVEKESKSTFETQNQMLGTPSYMAPEQLRQETVGPMTDIYSAGLIFIELLNGNPLLEGTMVEVVAKHISTAPHKLPPEAAQSPFAEIITRAVAKNPKERYADARLMYQALEAIDVGAGPQRNLDTGPNRAVNRAMSPKIALITPPQSEFPSRVTGDFEGPILSSPSDRALLTSVEVPKNRLAWLLIAMILSVLVGAIVLLLMLLDTPEKTPDKQAHDTAADSPADSRSAAPNELPTAPLDEHPEKAGDNGTAMVEATKAANEAVKAAETAPKEAPNSTQAEPPEALPEELPPKRTQELPEELPPKRPNELPKEVVASSPAEDNTAQKRKDLVQVTVTYQGKKPAVLSAALSIDGKKCKARCAFEIEKGRTLGVQAPAGYTCDTKELDLSSKHRVKITCSQRRGL
ncbi:MAG: hypothetical protein CO108_04270 [Deltaproteobacteria bacterium CG_4_9_14_3_um_filter_63_12]|nr:MAG: hypothetical protein CO108_04270 [Deltaproteobacteria bacterium CG_4_9_14_3_um_filter_63_12]